MSLYTVLQGFDALPGPKKRKADGAPTFHEASPDANDRDREDSPKKVHPDLVFPPSLGASG